MIDIDLLMYALCMLGLFIAAAYVVCRIIKGSIDEGIAYYNEKPTDASKSLDSKVKEI